MSSRHLISSTCVSLALALGSAVAVSAQTIPVERADVDRDCTVTRTDATITQAQVGKRPGQAGYNENADVDRNGTINAADVTFVTRNVGAKVCTTPPPPPPAAPTIAASVAPAANANGWNNTNVTVTFLCTNATTCPASVTLAGEGANQVVERTVANSAGVTATARLTLNIDKTAPVLTVPLPSAVLPGASVAVPVTATDLSGLGVTTLSVHRATVSTRTASPFSHTWSVAATAAIGTEETLEVIAEDRAGNVASVRKVIAIDAPDTIAPTIALSAPATAAPGAMVPVVVQAADNRGLAGVVLSRLQGSTSTPVENRTTAPFTFQAVAQIPEGLTAGSVVTFAATATDTAGNTAAGSATVQVVTTVETTELRVVVDPPVSPTFQTSGVISGTIGRGTASVPPPAMPIVAAVSPAVGRQGQTLDIVVTGISTGFAATSSVTFGPGVTVQSITVTDDTHLTARVAIATNAGIGPRVVAVSTGTREGLLASGFAVEAGRGTLSGRLLNAQGQPIANAQVCLQGTTTCVTTGSDGRFTFSDLSVDVRRVVVTAAGYESATVPIALSPNGTATVGDIPLVVSNLPPPPPLPSSPPIAPKLAVVLGRGATEYAPGGNQEQLRKLIRDSIIAVGGRELGVLDASGQQLNPAMAGAGVASFTSTAVDEIADEMIAGDTISLAKLFQILIGSLKFPSSVPLPTLAQLIDGYQTSVNAAWADPSRPDAPMLMLLFNQGRVASATPPRVAFDTRFNALQTNVMTVSFLAFVNRFMPPPQANLFTTPSPSVVAAARPRWTDRVLNVASLLVPRGTSGSASLQRARFVTGAGASMYRAPIGARTIAPFRGANAFEQTPGPSSSTDRPASLMWETVVSGILPSGGWTVAQQAGKLCDTFLVQLATDKGFQSVDGKSPAGQKLAEDPAAKFLPAPECKTTVELLEILMTSGSEAAKQVGERYGTFFLSEGATRETAQRLQQQFTQQSYKEAFAQARAEAKALNIASKTIGVMRNLAEGAITKVQGAVVDTIFQLEVGLVIESLRPRQPFIKSVEQLTDPETTPATPSHIVKITFSRSPNDKGVYDNPDIMWWYELHRGRSGAIQPVAGKQFDKKATDLVFYDEVPADGTYVYSIRGRRQVGYPLNETTVENTFVSKTLDFLGGFFDTTVKIGGQAVFGLEIVKTVTTPLADIYKGVRLQYSDLSDPEQIYVSTRPPTPRPPANLAIAPNGDAFVSIPSLNNIFRVRNGVPSLFANANFKAPGPVGLAIDALGDLYSDNSASDAEFGGRIFSFRNADGGRDIAGTVNYYSQLISFANPVSVQALAIGSGFFGEELFIADAQNQRITHMTLPRNFPPGVSTARNVSQPYATSPLFEFGPSTAIAVSNHHGLAVTQGKQVMLVPLPDYVLPLFDPPSASPFQELSGVTFDIYGNMYLSDAVAGTISMIPIEHLYARHGLDGVSAIDRKKLTVLRGTRRPSDVKLAADRDGLAFFDGERAFASLRFGMAGQLTNAAGTPLSGANVYVPELKKLAVTDADGIFVMSDLVEAGASPIVDFVVSYEGERRSYRRVLDTYKHNIVDVVFGPPPAPPVPPSVRPPPPPPLPPDPPTTKPSGPGTETVSVAFDLAPPPGSTPVSPGDVCPRAVFLAPAYGIGVASPTAVVTGMLSNRHFSSTVSVTAVSLVLNGTATVVPLTNHEFSTTVTLASSDNTMTIAVPASTLKPIGCADPSLDDAALVTISPTHRVFHDTRPDELTRYRTVAGFDLAVRGIIREGGYPLAGLSFQVPGTDYQATSDGDGVFQVNLPAAPLAGAASAADRLGDELFTRLGGIVSLLRAGRRAESLSALSALLLQAMAIADAPPQAATTVDALLGKVLLIEGTARSLIQTLESPDGIPDPADITALESLGTQVAATDSNGQIVVRGREYPQLTITVNVR